MIAYIIAVFALGIPLMVLEISAGRTEKGSPVKTFRLLNRRAAIFGWAVVLLTLIIMSYYLAITGWTLGFALESYRGNIQSFEEFTNSYISLLYFFIVVSLTSFVVAKGVKAIEFMAKLLMPLLAVIIVFLAGYSLSLDKAGYALSFLFNPELKSFLSLNVWLLAFGQAFYSLAVGQGYLITYGSFLPKTVNLPRSTAIIASFETTVALLAGIIIFPIVFSFGMNPEQGTQLAFTTLHLIFESIAFGKYLAVMFFTLFFLAAISSCIAGMEVVKTAVREEFGVNHKKATLFSFIPVIPLGFLSALSFTPMEFSMFGRPFLDVLDLFAANQIVVGSGLIGGAIISWSISKRELVSSLGSKWKRAAGAAISIFRILPFFALAILLISMIV